MKKIIWTFALVVGVIGAPSFASETIQMKEVQISLNDVYIPADQKSGGESYVVVSGMFPNSCYQWERVEINHKTPMFHEVKAIAQVAQTMCLMVLVPFSKEVVLGKLIQGEHTLRFMNGDGTFFEKKMDVK